MTAKKRIIALVLSIVAICCLAGCGDKDDTKAGKSDKGVVSQEKGKTDLVGTWVVTKSEAYDGPLKAMVEQLLSTYYYVGSEHVFTADGVFKTADGKLATKYSVLDENHITMTDLGSGEAVIYDYELNGDEFVMYGNYTGLAADLGHSNVVHFKRK